MKKSWIRAISILLVAVMALGVFAGCTTVTDEPSIEADITSVSATKNEVRITFTLTNAKFIKDLAASNIELSGSFAEMTVKVESVKDETAVLVLTGTMKANEDNSTYSDGVVKFKEGAFSDKLLTLSKSFAVALPMANVDETGFSYSEGKLSVKLNITGYKISDDFSKNDITVDGKTVESLSVSSDGVLVFTISTSATSLDDAIVELSKKNIVIKASAIGAEEDITINKKYTTASFFTKDTLVENVDENTLRLTFVLFAEDGKFASDLSKDSVTLYGDLESATLESVTVSSDSEIGIVITVPQTLAIEHENEPDLLIELAAGSMINNWGTKTISATEFYQKVNTLINSANDATSDFKLAVEICGKMSSSPVVAGLATVCPVGGAAVSVLTGSVAAIYDLCRYAGLVETGPSEFEIISANFQEVNRRLDAIDKKLLEISKELQKIELEAYIQESNEFAVKQCALDSYSKSVASMIEKAEQKLMKGEKAPTETLEKVLDKLIDVYEDGMTDEDLYYDKLSSDDRALIEAWNDYYDKLFSRLEEEANKPSIRGNEFKSYFKTVEKLEDCLEKVCIDLKATGSRPFEVYDQICKSTYLFDLTSIPSRELYRATALGNINCAMMLMMQIHGGSIVGNDDATLFSMFKEYYAPAVNAIKASVVKRDYPADPHEDRITFYPASVAAIPMYFGSVRFDAYDPVNDTATAAGRQKVVEKATKYYNDLKNLLFYNTIDTDETKEIVYRMRALGYDAVGTAQILKKMGCEASIMAQVAGKEYESKNYKRYVYLENFDSFEFNWTGDSKGLYLLVTLKGCSVYDTDTGEAISVDTYNFVCQEDDGDIYAIYSSSTH